MQKLKISVIDKNKFSIKGLGEILSKDKKFNIIEEQENILINSKIYNNSDIIIIDPYCTNKNYISKIENRFFDKVFILTNYIPSNEELQSFIKLKIKGYLLKSGDLTLLPEILTITTSNGVYCDYEAINPSKLPEERLFCPKYTTRKEFKKFHSNLTEREYEVLKLIVAGKSNSEIAEELYISNHTAKAHVCNIIQKFLVDDRTQVAVKALKEGIL